MTGTSRASASCQSGRRGRPDRRRAALSRTELAGRGAGRGGSSSAVVIGSTAARVVAGGREDRPGEAVPGGHSLVGHVESAGEPLGGQHRERPGQVGGEGRAPVLVVDETQRARADAASRRTVPTMLAPWAPETHDVRTTVASGPDLLLAAPAWSARRPRGGGAGPIPVGPVRGPVEDVVGRDVDEMGADAAGRLGHVPGAEGVDGEGAVGIATHRRRPPSTPPPWMTMSGRTASMTERTAPRSVTSSGTGDRWGRPRARPRRPPPPRPAGASRGDRWRHPRPDRRSGTRPERASTRSRPSWPAAPVTRTFIAGPAQAGSAGRPPVGSPVGGSVGPPSAPRGLDHRGPVPERLPPGPVGRVPPDGRRPAPRRRRRSVPNRARSGSWCSRGGSDGRGRGGRGRSP